MRFRSALVLATAIQLAASLAAAQELPQRAERPKQAIVALRYLVSEQSPERVEQTVTNPLERSLLALPRMTDVFSRTGHGAVDIEIHFEGGATQQDLDMVEWHVDRVAFERDVEVASRATLLAPPALR